MTNLNLTPRTDAAATDGWSGDAAAVSVEFAQELERENNRLAQEVLAYAENTGLVPKFLLDDVLTKDRVKTREINILTQENRELRRAVEPGAESRVTDVPEGPNYYGNTCPKGKVQIEFVGCSPKERYSNYGWKPVDSAFLEVWVDGQRYRIDVGSFQSGSGAWRRGIHVNGPINLTVDKHSMNAADLFHEETPENRRGES